jgi:hypothetical protein
VSNERLRGAIIGAGLNLHEFSEKVGVDPKTVERWITKDRIPHRTHRINAGAILGKSDGYLWPTTQSDGRSQSASQAEVVVVYPNRGSVSADIWTSLIDQAAESIDLLAFAGSFLHDSVPGFADRLAERARSGVRVRLLFGDPASEAVDLRGREEGIDDLMAARCRLTWNYLQPVQTTAGIQARQHGTTLYASIFRFDETLLANVHAYGASASHSPVLHLNRIPGGRLFTHYMESFDRVWESGTPVS